MQEVKTGQRLLLALVSPEEERETIASDDFSIQGIILCVASVFAFLVIVVLCACKDGKSKERKPSNAKIEKLGDDIMTKSDTTIPANDVTSMENGGPGSNRNSANMSKHSRQASSASGSNIRPTSLRELPEPPVNSHHSRNTSMSGAVITAGNSINEEDGGGSSQRPSENGVGSAGMNQVGDTDSNGYDHFGPKKMETPAGYDHLGNVMNRRRSDGQDTPTSEISGGGVDGHHYAQPKERMYDVVKDVKAGSNQLYHTESSSQIKEEDPYNQIGESDGTVPSAIIKRIRQSTDPDDPYATVQGDSDGSFAVIAAQTGKSIPHQPPSSIMVDSTLSSSSPIRPQPKSPEEDEAEEEDEYAVVQKPSSSHNGGSATPTARGKVDDYDNGSISPYNTYRPPEPPRLYDQYSDKDEDDDFYEDGDLNRPAGSKEHTYSKVTARESLASMSARNALNPYETVPDLPENTYATVEGGSGDGVVPGVTMRQRMERTPTQDNRLSENSDTYAEIGISGGGLTTSVMSNASNSSANAASTAILGTSSGSSNGAPVPPSLDSLHQMTKSQTSSEGDRLSDRTSDRYLASPDDWIIPGQFDNIGHSDESEEDGYSTLTRVATDSTNGGARSSTRATASNGKKTTITDVESGEVTLIPNYDGGGLSFRDRGQDSLDGGNDPNYESVDETRAKVALLKARDSANNTANAKDFRNSDWTSSDSQPSSSSSPHVTVVNVFHKDSKEDNGFSSSVDGDRHRRMRRLNHDYEEVDLSPPSSPIPSQQQNLSTSAPPDMDSLRERVLNSHTYEELPHAKQAKKEAQRKSSGEREVKKKHSSSEEKKKSKEEKKKLKMEDKKKGASAASGESSAASWDGSKKSDSWETNRTRL